MASLTLNSQTVVLLSVASFLLLLQFPQVLHAQITTPCTATGITGLTPCMNFLTNSSGNGASSPTQDCCNSLKNLTGASMDCICLVLAAGVPFQVPINRNLAITLPRACNMPGVPLQCKAAAGSPVPAPGPAVLGPSSLAPGVSPSDTPSSENSSTRSVVPGTPSDGSTPGSGTTTPSSMTPPSSTTPTTINSSPPSSYSLSLYLLILALAFLLIKFN